MYLLTLHNEAPGYDVRIPLIIGNKEVLEEVRKKLYTYLYVTLRAESYPWEHDRETFFREKTALFVEYLRELGIQTDIEHITLDHPQFRVYDLGQVWT